MERINGRCGELLTLKLIASSAICSLLTAGCYDSHSRPTNVDSGIAHDARIVLPVMLCEPGETRNYATDCPPAIDEQHVFRPFNGIDYTNEDGNLVDYCYCALWCGPGECPSYPGTDTPMECRTAVENISDWGMCFLPCEHDRDCPPGSICAPLGEHTAQPWRLDRACVLAGPPT